MAAEFARQGCWVIDSDRLNREVMTRPEVISQVRAWWGDGVITAAGSVDRATVARIVFSDAQERKRLERLVHPLIDERRAHIMKCASDDRAVRAIILDSPLLFESNLNRLCDRTIFVDASEENRIARVRQARGWDEPELKRREAHQWPVERKRAACDFVIRNDAPVSELASQVAAILDQTSCSNPLSE